MTAEGPPAVTAGALWAELSDELGRSDAKWLLAHVTGRPAAALRAGLTGELPAETVAEARRLAARCRAGEPVQYVVGSWSFRSIEVELDRRVLIPRPETEQVAGVALGLLSALETGSSAPVVADLGTGSGAIALSLAAESPVRLDIWATDLSDEALEVARRNLESLGPTPSSVHLAAGDWYSALPGGLRGRLDLVVANPPYVARREWELLDSRVRDHEPYRALVAGEEGTEAVDEVVAGAARWLAPGGGLVVEIGAGQASHAAAGAAAAGLADISVRPDLAGHDRIVVARRPGR